MCLLGIGGLVVPRVYTPCGRVRVLHEDRNRGLALPHKYRTHY